MGFEVARGQHRLLLLKGSFQEQVLIATTRNMVLWNAAKSVLEGIKVESGVQQDLRFRA